MSQETIEFKESPILREIKDHSQALKSSEDFQPLLDRLADSDYILLGEATHGTSEFYRYRATLTKKLIKQQNISFIAVEGDWPDCYRINQYVKHEISKSGYEVLSNIERWPRWMWSNWEILEFIEWLREYNKGKDKRDMVGFFGLDVYSLNESMKEVIGYLEKVDPGAAEDAKAAYQCFEPYTEGADYAEKTRMVPESCEDQVVETLAEMRKKQFNYEELEGDEFFNAEQNALVAKNAENYYRALTEASTNSWNIRDQHMMETLERLMDQDGAAARSVVWAHNSHVGDSRATNMETRGQLNLGKLVREKHRKETSIIGFSTYRGNVFAADYWGGDPSEKSLPEAREGSYERLIHRVLGQDGIVYLEDSEGLRETKGHRAVGVIYHPESESGNYVPTELANRYDFLIHVDQSSALHPIQTGGEAKEPETYPWGV